MAKPHLSKANRTVTVRVPISMRQRGGRKVMLTPAGEQVPIPPSLDHPNITVVKAIARAFRWRELLENGTYATIAEIAAAEKITESYVSRILRLTLLAPDVTEACTSCL